MNLLVFSSQQKAEGVDHCKLQQRTNSLHIVQLEYPHVLHHSFQPEQQVSNQRLSTKCATVLMAIHYLSAQPV